MIDGMEVNWNQNNLCQYIHSQNYRLKHIQAEIYQFSIEMADAVVIDVDY